jgi:hypothetical protein
LALIGYGLCYSAAGALLAWVSFLVVALWFDSKVDEVTSCWEAGSIVAGLLVAAWLAWRAKQNTLAHVSLLVLGVTQAIASAMYAARFALDSERTFESWLSTGGAVWIGAAAAIAAVGGFCGLVAHALSDSTAPDQT